MTSVTITQQPITATVNGSTVQASVPAATAAAATVTGGVGPQGPVGPVGPVGSTTLAALTDVQVQSAADGDLLEYVSGKWKPSGSASYPIDGGNW